MQIRTQLTTALAALALVAASGCAVQRGQETVGAYVDDAAITTSVKSSITRSVAIRLLAFRSSRRTTSRSPPAKGRT